MSINILSQYQLILAHGAGANKDSEWMNQLADLLNKAGLEVIRFNFPYMLKSAIDGRRRPPDRMPKLIDAFSQQILQAQATQTTLTAKNSITKKLIVGGKSMGSRVASLLAVEPENANLISAVVCLGFPFHPPTKPDKYRGNHLQKISIPTLILQGERDSFGTRAEIEQFELSQKVEIEYLSDGDHSFKPRVRSGLTLANNLQQASNRIIAFINRL